MTTEVKEKKIRPVFFLVILFVIPNALFLVSYGMIKLTGTKWMDTERAILKTEAILINLKINKLEESKSASVQTIEEDIKNRLYLSKAGEFGGKICKEGNCILSVLGVDTDRLYQIIKPVLKTLPQDAGYLEIIYDLKNSNDRVKQDLY